MQKVFLIHGWSVTETTTYQALHLRLAEHGFDLKHIYLGRYVSLDNDVEIKDIAHAMHRALTDHLGKSAWSGPIHMITHSTGALVVKQWLANHYVGDPATKRPLKNLIFLAGPHFGSRLAHHGRSMMSQAFVTVGESGKQILNSLELGSQFGWQANGELLTDKNWLKQGIRAYCLIGDRVRRDIFKSRIFPAAYEKGSDGVVRVAAGNLNFRRYRLEARTRQFRKLGEVSGVPFAALGRYEHSEREHGIMNSIITTADPGADKYQNLKLILDCLRVGNASDYQTISAQFASVTRKTRKQKPAFAQLDLWFRDDTGAAIQDYLWELGVYEKGVEKPSKTIAHTHKNKIDASHFTVFLNLDELEPKRTYFMRIMADSGTPLFLYQPNEFTVQVTGKQLRDIITADQTTQIEVVFERSSDKNLFRFHSGDDKDLHVRWDREGAVTKKQIQPK
jgi:hypothetical protein